MIIWILDYVGCQCLRINPLPDSRREIREKYNGNVEEWLLDHEDELGIRLNDCYFMTTMDNDDYRSIHI